MNLRRVAPTAVIALVVLAVIVGTPVLLADQLPDPIAAHWGFSGEPDRADSAVVTTVIFAVMWAVLGGSALLALRHDDIGGRQARQVAAAISGAGGLLAAVWVAGLLANAGASDWTEARLPFGMVLLPGLMAAATAGMVAWMATPSGTVAPHRWLPDERITLAPGEQAVWAGRATNRITRIAFVAVLAIPALLLLPIDSGLSVPVAIILAVSALPVLVFGSVDVAVGPGGIRVALGPLRWPRVTVPLADIAEVKVEHVRPTTYGGWGFRLVSGTRGVIIRAGAGIHVTRRDGMDLVVTVDGAAKGAAVLQAHLDRLDAPT